VYSGDPEQFNISMILDDGRKLNAVVKKKLKVVDGDPVYERWVGGIEGTVGDSGTLSGQTLFEQFKFFGLPKS